MKIIVFGATGTVGRSAVDRILAEGHQVTAFARRPEKLNTAHPNLTCIAGDALEEEAVQKAVSGHDCVVVTLGAGASPRSKIRSLGSLNIIRAMQAHGIRRLICLTTLGAHESRANLNFFWKWIMFGVFLRPAYKDHEMQENLVRASGLDWTLVRPGSFTDGPLTGAFKENFGCEAGRLSFKISKSDVADFLNRQLTENRYIGRAVAISN